MDIDKLFKRPNLPASALKKGSWTPEAAAAHASRESAVEATGLRDADQQDGVAGPSRARPTLRATVQDDDDEDVYGPSMGSMESEGHSAMEQGDEEEDSRFFGGGLTDQQRRILDILDQEEDSGPASQSTEISVLKKQLVRFERTINRNQEMRMKHADDPKKFIESEADLDGEIRALVILTTNPALLYKEAIKNDIPASLCSLMSHENEDIVVAVVTLIEELTDDDVLEGAEENGRQMAESAMSIFVDALLKNQILDLLLSNLDRFINLVKKSGAEQDADEQGIYHTFAALDNLIGLNGNVASKLATNERLVNRLLELVNAKGGFSQNKGYAAELLAVLCQHVSQNSGADAKKVVGGKMDAIDGLLRGLSAFRKRDPVDADETEFMENLFDALCALLADDGNKQVFLKNEGVELMVIMSRSKLSSRLKAVKVLDHAMSGPKGKVACLRFVESLGLKSLFQLLMARNNGKRREGHDITAEDEEHVLSIMVSLLNALPRDSMERIRFLAKFVEKDYEKLDRLLELRERFRERLARADAEQSAAGRQLELGEDEQEAKELLHLERLESGLFALQLCDYILAWVCVEDDGVRDYAKMLLLRRGQRLSKDVAENLQAYYYDLGDGEDDVVDGAAGKVNNGTDTDSGGGKAEQPTQREVIVDLVNQLLNED
ncbi:DUF1716-domain-containing protein [Tilletiaria anomala UBC 951]|uniref:DUF1716-domain-containing protein n=1 Tax=Tilletiaria anomala (strain ATCC 24038 / CBS 436.72 / UBC 951) TaxID=1037660 RepID=A0A066VIG7_TILAU|nr:DUF1716-domain-containing protein [Tilletiaria anomala UBC 951]KDN38524.1 DUF1716-domain-containing protein [Tilletiaria anomala UBC 951]